MIVIAILAERDLAQEEIAQLVDAVAGHELEPQINPELMQSVLEIATPVCHTPADVMNELVKLRGYVCGVARAKGLRVGSAGTHPFSLFERQRITAKDRYRQLVDQRDRGVAVLLVSAELDEVLALSDRVAVIYEGRIQAVMSIDDASREKVGLLMAGDVEAAATAPTVEPPDDEPSALI